MTRTTTARGCFSIAPCGNEWWRQPRILYSVIFPWLAIVEGYFIAPFLQEEGHLESSSWVGWTMGLQIGISSLFAILGSSWADRLEAYYKREAQGRSYLLMMGIFLGTLLFLLHGLQHFFVPLNARHEEEEQQQHRAVLFLQENHEQTFHQIKNFVHSISLSPWWHVALRVLYGATSAVVLPVLDGMTLAHLQTEENRDEQDYGMERLYGAVAWGISSAVLGICVDAFGFKILYVLSFVTMTIILFVVPCYVQGQVIHQRYAKVDIDEKDIDMDNENDDGKGANQDKGDPNHFDLQEEDPTVSAKLEKKLSKSHENDHDKVPLWKLLQILLGSVLAVAFFTSYLILSSGLLLVENLVFIFFEFLGGSHTWNGLTIALQVLFEVPLFSMAPTLLRRLGGGGALLQIANVAYIVRVLGYSLIPQGQIGWVVVLEPLHGIIYATSQMGSVELTTRLVPRGYQASGQGFLALVKGLGGVIGLSVGGMLQERWGPRIMYRIFAATTGVGCLLFGLGTWFDAKRQSQQIQKQKQTPESELEIPSLLNK